MKTWELTDLVIQAITQRNLGGGQIESLKVLLNTALYSEKKNYQSCYQTAVQDIQELLNSLDESGFHAVNGKL